VAKCRSGTWEASELLLHCSKRIAESAARVIEQLYNFKTASYAQCRQSPRSRKPEQQLCPSLLGVGSVALARNQTISIQWLDSYRLWPEKLMQQSQQMPLHVSGKLGL
jgi:hypothetical protein